MIFNDNIEIIFASTDHNEYVLIIKDKNGEEFVNIEDIEYVKISEKYQNSLEFCYKVWYLFMKNI